MEVDARAPTGVLQPDARATLTGVARYLRATALPAVEDARVRRELKNAAALLDAAVGPEARADDAELEAAAAERERSPARPAAQRAPGRAVPPTNETAP